RLNEGRLHFCSPPLKVRKEVVLNFLYFFPPYLPLGYGAASVSMTSFAGVTTPGEANNYAPGSCQLPRPIRTPDACSISAVLWFHPDLQLLRHRMAFYGSYLVDGSH
ncbi:hypothetical protein Tco_0125057, partial [Tanacetum coccineum]